MSSRTSALIAAFTDDDVCNHFLEEPSTKVGTRFSTSVVRVGKQVDKGCAPYRAGSVGYSAFKRQTVLWAVDRVAGHESSSDFVYIARVKTVDGSWSEVLQAVSLHRLLRLVLPVVGASAKTKVSAPDFFARTWQCGLPSPIHKFVD